MATAERLTLRTSMPGPLLASPLSTSLSAMVADLKRGGSVRGAHGHVHHNPESSDRRRESVLGIGASEHDEESGHESLERRRTITEENPSRPQGRGRSLSELWRGLRQSMGEDEDTNEESRHAEQEDRGLGK